MAIGSIFSDLFQRTLRDHPHMVLLMTLMVAMSLVYSFKVFAERTDVHGKFAVMGERIDRLESKVDLRYLETTLHSLEREIYQLERLTNSGEANDRDHERLVDLQGEAGDVVRDINALLDNGK